MAGWVGDGIVVHVCFDFVLRNWNLVEVRCHVMFIVGGFGEGDSEEAEDGLFAFYFKGTVVGAIHFVNGFLLGGLFGGCGLFF